MDRFLFLSMCILSFLKLYNCEDCVFKNTCECVFRNGSVINLNSLASHTSYRWGSKKPTKSGNFTYYYNPCIPFKLGETGECSKGVAVCQVSTDGKNYYDCGDANSVNFHVEKDKIILIYAAPYSPFRSTNVTLVCSEYAEEPELIVDGEVKERQYAMTLTTKCACPDLCRTSHLSTGSVLLILFSIFVSLYLFLGIIHSRLTRGAQGWELIPHYEFWAEFPLLVRDGCVFVVNGCKAETAYERI